MKRSVAIWLSAVIVLFLLATCILFVIGFVSEDGGRALSETGRAQLAPPSGPARHVGVEPAGNVVESDAALTSPEPDHTRAEEPREWLRPFRLRFVDPEGRGLADVRVECTDRGASNPHGRILATSGADGRALVDLRGPSFEVRIWPWGPYDTTSWYERLEGRDRFRERTIFLEPSRVLPLHVQDAAGCDMASVLLELRVRRGGEEDDDSIAEALTRSDGRAFLPLPDAATPFETYVTVDLPLAQPPRIAVDPKVATRDEVLLLLPPSAPMVVRPGQRLASILVPGTELRLHAAVGERFLDASASLEEDGCWRFPALEVGLVWRVDLVTEKLRVLVEGEGRELLGPQRANVLSEATLEADATTTRFSFRLLQADGGPAADLLLDVYRLATLESSDFSDGSYLGATRSDARGEVCFMVDREQLRDEWPEGPRRIGITVFGDSIESQAWYAALDFPDPPWGAEVDLGTATFKTFPLLAAGRVTDGEGRAIDGAHVRLVSLRDHDGETFDELFEDSDHDGALCDEKGGFQLHRPRRGEEDGEPEGPFLLLAGAPGCRLGLLEVASRGRRDLEIRLERAAEVELEVLVPEGFGLDDFEVVSSGEALGVAGAAAATTATAIDATRVAEPLGAGRFRVGSVTAGVLVVSLEWTFGLDLAENRPSVRLAIDPAWTSSSEPRLLRADFRGLLRMRDQRFVDEESRGLEVEFSCEGINVTALERGGEKGLYALPELLISKGMMAWAPGRWGVPVPESPTEGPVLMPRWQPIEVFVLDGEGQPFASDLKLELHASIADASFGIGDELARNSSAFLLELDHPTSVDFTLDVTGGNGATERRQERTLLTVGTRRLEVRFRP